MSGLRKNVAGQKWRVFAFDRTNSSPKLSDAAQITAKIAKDFGSLVAIEDTNPTETEDGYYLFDLTQEETNADVLDIYPESSSSNAQVIGCPAAIYTISTAAGAGAVSWTILTNDGGGSPIDGCEVWVSTDEAGSNVVASGTTDASGEVDFMLDAGDYYVWRQHGGYTFSNPQSMTVA